MTDAPEPRPATFEVRIVGSGDPEFFDGSEWQPYRELPEASQGQPPDGPLFRSGR